MTNPKFRETAYTAPDIRRVKALIVKMPEGLTMAKMAKELSTALGKPERAMKRWVIVALSFTDEMIDLFELGKINAHRLSRIAESDYPNPAYKEFVAHKAIEKNLSYQELDEVYRHLKAGKHPSEAIDIVRGVRPEKSLNRNDELSLDRLVKMWERDGFSWRQRAELIKQQGKIQVLQNGSLSSRIAYTLAAMKVVTGDMSRYVEELWKEVPQEMRDAVEAEFRGQPVRADEVSPPETTTEEATRDVSFITEVEAQAGPVLEAEPLPASTESESEPASDA